MQDIPTVSAEGYSRRIVGGSMIVGVALWIPKPLTEFEFALVQLLALVFILIGVYELLSSGLLNVFRAAFVLTLGIGLQLLALELVSFGELLALWPLSFITFGIVILLADIVEERYYPRRRYVSRS